MPPKLATPLILSTIILDKEYQNVKGIKGMKCVKNALKGNLIHEQKKKKKKRKSILTNEKKEEW